VEHKVRQNKSELVAVSELDMCPNMEHICPGLLQIPLGKGDEKI
jgi:hypothetical protein